MWRRDNSGAAFPFGDLSHSLPGPSCFITLCTVKLDAKFSGQTASDFQISVRLALLLWFSCALKGVQRCVGSEMCTVQSLTLPSSRSQCRLGGDGHPERRDDYPASLSQKLSGRVSHSTYSRAGSPWKSAQKWPAHSQKTAELLLCSGKGGGEAFC